MLKDFIAHECFITDNDLSIYFYIKGLDVEKTNPNYNKAELFKNKIILELQKKYLTSISKVVYEDYVREERIFSKVSFTDDVLQKMPKSFWILRHLKEQE